MRPVRASMEVSAWKRKKLMSTVRGLLMFPRMLNDVGDSAVLEKIPAMLTANPATHEKRITSHGWR